MIEQDVAIKLNDHDHEIGSLKHRIKECEDQQKSLGELVRSVDKLANNMEYMVAEQKSQGERLERLESAPADDYKYYKRAIISCIITGILGAVLGAVLSLIFK